MKSDKIEEPFPRGYAEHRRRQIRIGLAMTGDDARGAAGLVGGD